ncbi:MAG: RNA polymerase sigma factor [Actinobacteria bacterium]|nr:MAG: RNA polymerase sigma factor [Actinomycetota bacterium]
MPGRPEAASNGGDAELVQRVLAGEPSAFAALYRSYAAVVARAVRDQVRDAESVADAVQETFARALEQLHTLREPQRFRAWLLAIARHTAVDQRRLRSRMTSIEDSPAAVERAALEAGPDEVAEVRELARLVRGCVAGLSRRDATAIALVTELGLSPGEVGATLGMSNGAAKVAIHRARRRLRYALELEVLVHRHRGTCSELCALCDTGELVRAARHLRDCPVCVQQVRSEIELFENRTAPRREQLVGTAGDPSGS